MVNNMVAGIFLILGFLLVPLAVIVAIILLLTKKSEISFQKRLDTIYTYIILLITIAIAIFGAISAITAIGDILVPTSSGDFNDQYIQLITSIGCLIVSLPIFFTHQKQLEKKKE